MKTDHDTAQSYERHAREFLRYRDESRIGARVVQRWARTLNQDAEVIEIACGGGYPVTRTLIESGLKVWAIDASPTLLAEFSRRFPGIPTACETAQKSEFFQRQFDAAIAVGLVFLLNKKDQLTTLHKVSAALRPGGHFLFNAPTEKGTWNDIITGQTCISLGRAAYTQSLEQAGFRIKGDAVDGGQSHYYLAVKTT